jgi:hypothetical protein
MRVLRLAVMVCCLISTFSALPIKGEEKITIGKCRISDFKTEYADAKAVFLGEITNVETDGDVKIFTFKVEKYWKGAANKKIEINVQQTMRYQAWFKVGEKYLVFARGDESGEKLWERRCSRTKALANASEDLQQLGKGKIPR